MQMWPGPGPNESAPHDPVAEIFVHLCGTIMPALAQDRWVRAEAQGGDAAAAQPAAPARRG